MYHAEQGAKVTAHYNTNFSTLESLINEYGPTRIRAAQANLTVEQDVAKMFNAQSEALGPVQIIVVNHGYYRSEDVPLAQMSLEQWNETMNANLTSSFLVLREYLKRLKIASDAQKERAAVVLIGSTAGKYGEDSHADYASSKSGKFSRKYAFSIFHPS